MGLSSNLSLRAVSVTLRQQDSAVFSQGLLSPSIPNLVMTPERVWAKAARASSKKYPWHWPTAAKTVRSSRSFKRVKTVPSNPLTKPGLTCCIKYAFHIPDMYGEHDTPYFSFISSKK